MFKFDSKLSTAIDVSQSAPAQPPWAPPTGPLSPELLAKMQRYWDAANYLTVGQIYLRANPLLLEPLQAAHIKPRLLGHWGTSSGQNFIYVHLNRLITEKDANFIFISGPGHGGPAMNANSYLEGTYSEVHPEYTQDVAGLKTMFREFSSPGGVPSHCGPHVPNSLHEGGELGYALLHAFGAVFDNPELIVACVVGDGEAETAALEGSWKGVRFLNAARDGAVLPILHMNGYKISGPTVEARMPDDELTELYSGRGYKAYFVEGDQPQRMHQAFATALDQCYGEIRDIQADARRNHSSRSRKWPMIVLRTPKGWTGPKEVDGLPIEGTFRAHQVPLANVREESAASSFAGILDAQLPAAGIIRCERPLRFGLGRSCTAGRPADGRESPCEWRTITDDAGAAGFYRLCVAGAGSWEGDCRTSAQPGEFLRDTLKYNPANFRIFCPDETNSNRLNAVFEATTRCTMEPTVSIDEELSPTGRVMEVLSEHCTEGWLEGYVLTGRHGVWSSYEAFAQIVDSMITQHVKWLSQCREIPWRRPLASLNVFLSSHAWRNDHNGFSHQSPGFVDNVLQRRSEIVRVYYPPDANCLLSVMDHCLRSRDYVNVVTCGKQFTLQWLTMDEALAHCSQGVSAWQFASNDGGSEPDVVLACAGDVPTQETVAASWLLQKHVPGIKVRVVNVVDLSVLMSPADHPHGLDNISFDSLFTPAAPVIFAHHGYPAVIHSMVHGRATKAAFTCEDLRIAAQPRLPLTWWF